MHSNAPVEKTRPGNSQGDLAAGVVEIKSDESGERSHCVELVFCKHLVGYTHILEAEISELFCFFKCSEILLTSVRFR